MVWNPCKNELVERINIIILENARYMLSNASLSKDFRTKVVQTTTHLINGSLLSTIDFKTPEKLWNKRPADYSHLRIFGSIAYAHTSDGKLQPRAKKCVLVGYRKRVKRHRL